jgi:hypothetical protein
MKALSLLALGALLCFGCDDTDVASKAADLLEHGAVEASIVCEVPRASTPLTICDEAYDIRAKLLVDGSSFVQCTPNPGVAGLGDYGFSSLNERGESVAAHGRGPGGHFTCSLGGGEVSFAQTGTSCSRSEDIETYCTGRNLEAFGVD